MDRRSFLCAAAAFPPLAVAIAACGDRTIESGGTSTPPTTTPASSAVSYPTGPDDVAVGDLAELKDLMVRRSKRDQGEVDQYVRTNFRPNHGG